MPPKLAQMIREQEEQKIFKEFEELGYKQKVTYSHKQKVTYSHMIFLVIDDEDPDCELKICINKESRAFWKFYGNAHYECFTIREHQLLHRLFEIWGWLE